MNGWKSWVALLNWARNIRFLELVMAAGGSRKRCEMPFGARPMKIAPYGMRIMFTSSFSPKPALPDWALSCGFLAAPDIRFYAGHIRSGMQAERFYWGSRALGPQPRLQGLGMFHSTTTKPEYFFLPSLPLHLSLTRQEISAASHDEPVWFARIG